MAQDRIISSRQLNEEMAKTAERLAKRMGAEFIPVGRYGRDNADSPYDARGESLPMPLR
jgi:hypothetical protein